MSITAIQDAQQNTFLGVSSLDSASDLSNSGGNHVTRETQRQEGEACLRVPLEHLTFERQMGDTELSYYLPARADGVNDMYLNLGFSAPASLCAPERITAIWALLRLRHPPLASTVIAHDWVYDDVRFSYSPPTSPWKALAEARRTLSIRKQSKEELIDEFLNGDRILGDSKLSCLVVASVGDEDKEFRDYNWMMCAVHFLGDGVALHRSANEFFALLAGDKSSEEKRQWSTEELENLVQLEWELRWGSRREIFVKNTDVLPPPIEAMLPPLEGKLRRAAASVDFKLSQDKIIGGHTFPKRKSPKRQTVVRTSALDEAKTKLVLKRCKERGVSIVNVLFALCGLAWSRVCARGNANKKDGLGWEMPLMMYSALNLRPYLLPEANLQDSSYWFVAIGYFNVVLPAFLPLSTVGDSDSDNDKLRLEKTLWHRARESKRQSTLIVKHPQLVARTHEMAVLRGERTRHWAREDDEKAKGRPSPFPAPPTSHALSVTAAHLKAGTASFDTGVSAAAKLPPAPSNALLGLSMLGNMDVLYQDATSRKTRLTWLHVTNGSRQRPGAILLFGYTFMGKLWLSLGYDECAFNLSEGNKSKKSVEGWWEEVLRGFDEFLVYGKA